MATITLQISNKFNSPPSQSGWLNVTMAYGATHSFTVANFSTETSPAFVADGALAYIKFSTLPGQGLLKLSGVNVIVNQEISVVDLNAGNLTYVANTLSTAEYDDNEMTFLVSDELSGFYNSVAQEVIFTVAGDTSINEAPTQVGNGSVDIKVGQTIIFERIIFTTLLDNPYTDAEGDAADKLKILELSSFGTMKLNGSLVVVDQEINFSDIDLGLLTYTCNSIPGAGEEDTFRFQISDTGSGNFIG